MSAATMLTLPTLAPAEASTEDARRGPASGEVPLHEQIAARRRALAKAYDDNHRLAELAVRNLANAVTYLYPYGRREAAQRDLRALVELLDRVAPSTTIGRLPPDVPDDITRRVELLVSDRVRAQLRDDAARLRAGGPLAPELLDGLADLLALVADGPDAARDTDDSVLLRDTEDSSDDASDAPAPPPASTSLARSLS